MNRMMLGVLVGLLVVTAPLSARVILPTPIPDRVARSAVVVTGKITAIERRTVKAKDGIEYHIAVVKIDKGLLGAGGLTHVKIGFVPDPPDVARIRQLHLKVGQEACFFLSKVAGEAFLVVADDMVNPEDGKHYLKEMEVVRRCAKAMANAAAGLKAKDPEERFLAAGMLIKKHRGPRYALGKFEPIPAAQSKPILEALAGADWGKRDEHSLDPVTVFYQLGLGEKDGWTHPGSFEQVVAEAKKWLKANAGTYRIQRRVEAE